MSFSIKETSRRWWVWTSGVVLGLALLALATQALAQTRDPEAMAKAEQVFRAGRAAMKAGDYAAACAKFEESLTLQPALGTLLNLAVCEEKSGRLLLSARHFQQFLERVTIDDQRRSPAASYLAGVKLRLPRLTVQVRGKAPANLKLELDGAPLSSHQLGRAIDVDPGLHVIAITVPVESRRRAQVVAFERQSVVHVFEFAEASRLRHGDASHKPPRPTPAEERSSSLAYWIAGAGLTSLAVGAVTGVVALQKKQTVDDHCQTRGSRTLCDQEGLDAIPQGRTFATISTVASAIGLAGLGVGAYLHFSPDARTHAAPRRPRAPQMALQLSLEHAW
jgi:hypothetical protein